MKLIKYIIAITIFSLIPCKVSAKELKLHAKSACLYDSNANRCLYGKEETLKLPMASTTKIMTCIIALENASLDSVVTVSHYASSMPDVKLNIKPNEQYLLKDLLHSLMLESHNDSAVAIAEYIACKNASFDEVSKRSIAESKKLVLKFADMMNKKANELDCTNTHFVTPNGLDDDKHYTTALELCMIADYAISNKNFLSITNTKSYTFSDTSHKHNFSINNKNAFLNMYNGAIGCKTGFTNNAGYCFVGAIKTTDNKTLISTVLASSWPPHKTHKWDDTKQLMDYGITNYKKQNIINNNKYKLPTVYVKNGTNHSHVSLYITNSLSLLLNDNEKITIKQNIPKSLDAPVLNNCVIGTLDVYIDNKLYIRYPIFTKFAVQKISYKYYLKKLINNFLLK